MARVLMFGRLADTAGWREQVVDAETLAALKAKIGADDPHLGRALDGGWVMTIVNDVLVRGDAAVCGDDEVAFLPPVGGG